MNGALDMSDVALRKKINSINIKVGRSFINENFISLDANTKREIREVYCTPDLLYTIGEGDLVAVPTFKADLVAIIKVEEIFFDERSITFYLYDVIDYNFVERFLAEEKELPWVLIDEERIASRRKLLHELITSQINIVIPTKMNDILVEAINRMHLSAGRFKAFRDMCAKVKNNNIPAGIIKQLNEELKLEMGDNMIHYFDLTTNNFNLSEMFYGANKHLFANTGMLVQQSNNERNLLVNLKLRWFNDGK